MLILGFTDDLNALVVALSVADAHVTEGVLARTCASVREFFG